MSLNLQDFRQARVQIYEPGHNIFYKQACADSEDSDKLRNRAVWLESSLSIWRRFGSLATLIMPSEDSVQTARMRRMTWFISRSTCNLVGHAKFWLIHKQITYNLSRPRLLSPMRVRLVIRKLRIRPLSGSATFFRGDWSWNIFYGHSLLSTDSRRAVVSFWGKNVHRYRLTAWRNMPAQESVVR